MKNQNILIAILCLILTACGEGMTTDASLAFPSNPSPLLENADTESPFVDTTTEQTSTFSIDVDTASYTIMRDSINRGQLPNASQVRLEEYINYFNYDYPPPTDNTPFAVYTQMENAPWSPTNKLLKIALRGKEIATENRGPSNLVFLIDTSGSMSAENKLPLLKSAMLLLVDQMTAEDSIGIVTYAGKAGIALEPTTGDQKDTIKNVINGLSAGGSTNGEAGLSMAYNLASFNYQVDGINRVILTTDGDFNVGETNSTALVDLIRSKAESSIFLSVFGFGMNYNDGLLESLADKGDGNYAYIDSMAEANKALGAEANGTLITIAKDVKLQVTFNSDVVAKYRLLGYDNRRLNNEDFTDVSKDAGDMGAGHNVVAFYELELVATESDNSNALIADIDIRYKEPKSTESTLYQHTVNNMDTANGDFFFAAAVAEYALILSNSAFKNNANLANVIVQAEANKGVDLQGYRQEFIDLVNKAKLIIP